MLLASMSLLAGVLAAMPLAHPPKGRFVGDGTSLTPPAEAFQTASGQKTKDDLRQADSYLKRQPRPHLRAAAEAWLDHQPATQLGRALLH